jgi:hypothetical protein
MLFLQQDGFIPGVKNDKRKRNILYLKRETILLQFAYYVLTVINAMYLFSLTS